jgi:hypothetical protein
VLPSAAQFIGAIAGGFLFSLIGAAGVTGFNLWSMFVAIVGAVVVLLVYHAISAAAVAIPRATSSIRYLPIVLPEDILLPVSDYPMPRRPSDPLPDFIGAQLATLVQRPPDGDAWLHEVKLDGYRVAAGIERGKVRMLTRHANDWTPRFRRIAAILAELQSRTSISTAKSLC